ncbi:YybH family protein [Psychroserpens luteolus]|uniref:YybH family protein n=1 Tax=Psychroserpens luteolus TaxID=2855840 RepID=UPI001E4152D9|nr:nuclear transport factor 2 family protein [Psychroserpens luteolus]MCD2258800.1 nuclear transport factor 2 family protein [Psychroserpens luteolus]
MKSICSILLLICTMQFAIAQTYTGNEDDIAQILKNTETFSEYIKASNYKMIGASYTADAKIFPNNKEIIEGTEAIINYWKLPKGVSIKYHKVTSHEIKILGDEAYDYGVYQGATLLGSGEEVSWKGKYVIVWKKENNTWKMYLDIWNSIK